MSRIPKLSIAAKANQPGLINGRKITRTIGMGLSEADKNNLILNHTRPLQNPVYVPSTASAPAPRFKRAATVPSTSAAPAKQARVEKKVAPKIAPYDYKARFNDLLEKHRAMKTELNDLKERHMEVVDDHEKVKDSLQSCTTERDYLKQQLLTKFNELKENISAYDKLKLDFEIQKQENDDLHRKTKLLEEITNSLKQKTSELDRIQSEHEELMWRHTRLREETEALRVQTDKLKKAAIELDKLKLDNKDALNDVDKYKSDVEALQNILDTMYGQQRDLRNTIQDLKGNIRVYCRVRPPLDSEANKPLFNLGVLDDCSIEVEKVKLNSSARNGKHSFSFDGLFTPHATQEDVFAAVSPMVQSALDGYNVCIFAYGQTGTGKTYTMEGGNGVEKYGIIPRAFNMIFTSMEDLKRMGWQLTIKASFLEIYNEIIYDLLNCSKDQISHDIKMVKSKDVYVSNLREEEVKSSHELIDLMTLAQRNRQTAATLNKERSSRSHSVAQITISAINEKRKEKYTSKLNLVDLAGSESGKNSQRMEETKHINRSLSELSKVILSLQTNQSHIPYRNSKLTHLLMPSLGGNSKTLMLVNINQFDECFSETLNSLRFATKVTVAGSKQKKI